MPDFAIVPMREAQVSTIAGRQGRFMQEYIRYIRQISQGQAGKLHLGEHENPVTIRRRLQAAATALGTKLIIKLSGEDIYFWKEDGAEEGRRIRRGRRPRTGRPGSLLPPTTLFIEPEADDQGVAEEETTALD